MIAIFCLLLLVLFVVEETQARGFDVMQETKGDDETTGDDGDTKPGEKMTMGDEETTGDDGDTKPGAPMKGAGETDDFDDFPDVTRKKHITFIRLLFEMLIIFQKTKQNKATFWTKKTTKKPSSTSSGASQQRACTTSDSTFVRQCHDPWIQCDEEKIVDECECLQVYLKCANQLNCWSKLRRSVALLEYGCAQDGVGFQVAAGSDATCTASDVKFRTCLQDAPACWQVCVPD